VAVLWVFQDATPPLLAMSPLPHLEEPETDATKVRRAVETEDCLSLQAMLFHHSRFGFGRMTNHPCLLFAVLNEARRPLVFLT
jgi:hypothetical protein